MKIKTTDRSPLLPSERSVRKTGIAAPPLSPDRPRCRHPRLAAVAGESLSHGRGTNDDGHFNPPANLAGLPGEAGPRVLLAATALLLACGPDRTPLSPTSRPDLAAGVTGSLFLSPDPTGQIGTVSTNGAIDAGNPFFQSLGTNGRSCATCHLQGDGFGLSAQAAQAAFAASGGTDPLFAAVDGANCPSVTVGAGAAGHSLLLGNGLIRVALAVPAGADFTVAVVYDPYGCALAGSPSQLSMYRRPLPTTNLRFLSAVMFDGRETIQPLTDKTTFKANLKTDLAHQAMDATLGHAQAAASPTASQLSAIVNFELALFTAQQVDNSAGALEAQRATGGPDALVSASFYPGINDPLGDNPKGTAFDPNAFTIFAAWQDLSGSARYAEARRAVARGRSCSTLIPSRSPTLRASTMRSAPR
jgi:hypothetical protein